MAEHRKDIVIKVFAQTKSGRVPVHSEGGSLTTSERRFAQSFLARVEAKQHLGGELRSRVIMDQEGIECLVEPIEPEATPTEKGPFHPDSEHYWRLGI